MDDRALILVRAEATLRPLHLAASQAWWDSSTAATEEHERQRVEAELALSDALADPDLYRVHPRALQPVERHGPDLLAKCVEDESAAVVDLETEELQHGAALRQRHRPDSFRHSSPCAYTPRISSSSVAYPCASG